MDSTARSAAMGDRAWRPLREAHARLARDEVVGARGRVIKSMGNGYLATFDGPARAIASAEAIVSASAGPRHRGPDRWVNPKAWVFALAVVGTFVPADVHRLVGVSLVTAAIVAIAAVSSATWAVGGAALGRLVEDGRRRTVVGVLLALLLVASVVLLWL